MRLRLSIFLLLGFLYSHTIAFAGANGAVVSRVVDVCEGIDRIEVNRDEDEMDPRYRNIIPTTFSNVQRYSCLNDTAYCLCFNVGAEIQNDGVPYLPNLRLDSSRHGKPLYIDGLILNSYENTITLTGDQPITFQNSTLSGCTDCLRVEGENHHLKNVAVTCGEKEEGIAGITLIGEGHRLENVNVHNVRETEIEEVIVKEWHNNCGVGIQIGEVDLPGNDIEIKNGELAGNGVGLWVANGIGNFFREVSIFQNDFDGNGIFETDEGILFDEGVNEDLRPPEVVLIDEENRGALRYAEEDTEGTEAYLKIRMESMSGKVDIYWTGETFDEDEDSSVEPQNDNGEGVEVAGCADSVLKSVADSKCQQGKEFLVRPKLASLKLHSGAYEQLLHFGMNKDLYHKMAVLVFNDGKKGSSVYSKTFVLNDKDGKGILSAAELDAPAAGGDLADAGSHSVTDALPTDSADEEDSAEESGMGVVGPADDGAGGGIAGGPSNGGPAILSGGIGAAGGGAGGIKAGGCSLIADNSKSLLVLPLRTLFPHILAWLSLPLLLALRRRLSLRTSKE